MATSQPAAEALLLAGLLQVLSLPLCGCLDNKLNPAPLSTQVQYNSKRTCTIQLDIFAVLPPSAKSFKLYDICTVARDAGVEATPPDNLVECVAVDSSTGWACVSHPHPSLPPHPPRLHWSTPAPHHTGHTLTLEPLHFSHPKYHSCMHFNL